MHRFSGSLERHPTISGQPKLSCNYWIMDWYVSGFLPESILDNYLLSAYLLNAEVYKFVSECRRVKLLNNFYVIAKKKVFFFAITLFFLIFFHILNVIFFQMEGDMMYLPY